MQTFNLADDPCGYIRHICVGTTLSMYDSRGSVCPINSGGFPHGVGDVRVCDPYMDFLSPPIFNLLGTGHIFVTVNHIYSGKLDDILIPCCLLVFNSHEINLARAIDSGTPVLQSYYSPIPWGRGKYFSDHLLVECGK